MPAERHSRLFAYRRRIERDPQRGNARPSPRVTNLPIPRAALPAIPLCYTAGAVETPRGERKIGMALTRRRQPPKAVGTQILCKRTRARARAPRTFLLIFDLGPGMIAGLAAELSHAHGHVYYLRASRLYARGNWLSKCTVWLRCRQPYVAQPDSLGMQLAYRNRALSDPRRPQPPS